MEIYPYGLMEIYPNWLMEKELHIARKSTQELESLED